MKIRCYVVPGATPIFEMDNDWFDPKVGDVIHCRGMYEVIRRVWMLEEEVLEVSLSFFFFPTYLRQTGEPT